MKTRWELATERRNLLNQSINANQEQKLVIAEKIKRINIAIKTSPKMSVYYGK